MAYQKLQAYRTVAVKTSDTVDIPSEIKEKGKDDAC